MNIFLSKAVEGRFQTRNNAFCAIVLNIFNRDFNREEEENEY